MESMTKVGNATRAYKRAPREDRLVLASVPLPAERAKYHKFLVEEMGYVFLPDDADQATFDRLMAENEELRAFVEDPETDPCLIAEYLLRRHPELFIAIEQLYHVATDYKTRHCKRRLGLEGEEVAYLPPPLPRDFYERMTDEDINIHVRYRLRSDVRRFNREPEGYLDTLRTRSETATHPNEQKILDRLAAMFEELRLMRFDAFHEHIKGSDRPFPSMHVRLWIRQMVERGSALICGDVGTAKTSASIVGLEEIGATRTLVVCRSYARNRVWGREIPVYYREAPATLVLKGIEDLKRLEVMTTRELQSYRFVIVGYGDLQHQNADRWVKALSRFEADSIIVDEAHAINHDIPRTARILALAQQPSVKHRIMLTATPFENHPNEVAFMGMLLAPEQFPTHEHFHAYCRDNPRAFYALMSKLMCTYFASEEVLDLPPSNVTRFAAFPVVELEPSRAATHVHELIRNDGALEATVQVMRMNQVLACPYIGRNWYQYPAEVNGYFRDPEKSDKLAWIKREIEARIKTGKIVVASGLYASGVTHDLKGAEDDPSAYVIVDQLKRWFGERAVIHIDGTMGIDDPEDDDGRNGAVDRWKNDPNVRIAVVSVQAAAESFEMTLRRSPGIEKLTILVLTLGWKPTQLHQFIGRYRRPGMEIPTEVLIAVMRGMIDEAMLDVNRQKWRNFLIGVQGIPLQDEESDALEKRIRIGYLDTDEKWMGDVLGRMRGAGEKKALALLDGDLRGRGIGETFARLYLENEDGALSGDVARFLCQVYKPWLQDRRLAAEDILDAACGVLVLERRLGEPVYGVDFNKWMVDVGRAHSYHGGTNAVVGPLSKLPEAWTARFRLTVCSLALHWSSNKGKAEKTERAKILAEFARVTAPDGIIHLILPPTSLDLEAVGRWKTALAAFGFEPVDALTGLVETRDFSNTPRSFWSVCARKAAVPALDAFEASLIAFADERKRASETVEVRPKRKGVPLPPAPPARVKHEAFVLLSAQGEKSPEAASQEVAQRCFTDETAWAVPFVTHIRRVYNPPEAWLTILTDELNRLRPTKPTDFSRLWDNAWRAEGAPKLKRAELRLIATEVMQAAK